MWAANVSLIKHEIFFFFKITNETSSKSLKFKMICVTTCRGHPRFDFCLQTYAKPRKFSVDFSNSLLKEGLTHDVVIVGDGRLNLVVHNIILHNCLFCYPEGKKLSVCVYASTHFTPLHCTHAHTCTVEQ